jgi:hypothetical protein
MPAPPRRRIQQRWNCAKQEDCQLEGLLTVGQRAAGRLERECAFGHIPFVIYRHRHAVAAPD